ncbi:OLC1v1029142C1 [Oldenlandia corymbosa var. corymbosa]|uniref:OLC1v1029142C1 n=1 Tax=Oldenlandia corymbosa var. corymbosa TaxID=529605 RepID=A0AAV1CDB0_OLDCO|nr:OLC1v1029142C1 [Oldenlandia corymbosa var. corymbosa]
MCSRAVGLGVAAADVLPAVDQAWSIRSGLKVQICSGHHHWWHAKQSKARDLVPVSEKWRVPKRIGWLRSFFKSGRLPFLRRRKEKKNERKKEERLPRPPLMVIEGGGGFWLRFLLSERASCIDH